MPNTHSSDVWIEDIVHNSSSLAPENPLEMELIQLLINACYNNKSLCKGRLGPLLASAFDLLVTAQYYSALTHTGWFYCPTKTPRIFFHYTNCCPREVLWDSFFFHPSNKPESGRIGTATARLLLLFYQALFKHHGHREDILKGTEPVDAIVINEEKRKVLFAEIKASPLVTLPVSALSQQVTEEVNGETIARDHSAIDFTNFFGAELYIFVPAKDKKGNWDESYYPIGKRTDANDRAWGFRGLIKLLESDPNFFPSYFVFWYSALKTYYPKDTRSIFWLTNACGTPSPIPPNWPTRRRGDGHESISDSKTSVGMDRTDDIKKGIYQVLKLGSEGKPSASVWNYKVGIISNIHAARHFDEYLQSLKDVIWTIDLGGKAKRISDLPRDQPMYNLFDGIVALTNTLSRDEWIESLFSPFN